MAYLHIYSNLKGENVMNWVDCLKAAVAVVGGVLSYLFGEWARFVAVFVSSTDWVHSALVFIKYCHFQMLFNR